MNKKAFESVGQSFSKMWNAKYILKDISKLHPNYFPVSIENFCKKNKSGVNVLENVKEKVLTEESFCKIYDRCGCALHVHNPFIQNESFIREMCRDIPKWLDEILLTMQNHMVLLYGTDLAYIVQLNGITENITYILCQKNN